MSRSQLRSGRNYSHSHEDQAQAWVKSMDLFYSRTATWSMGRTFNLLPASSLHCLGSLGHLASFAAESPSRAQRVCFECCELSESRWLYERLNQVVAAGEEEANETTATATASLFSFAFFAEREVQVPRHSHPLRVHCTNTGTGTGTGTGNMKNRGDTDTHRHTPHTQRPR